MLRIVRDIRQLQALIATAKEERTAWSAVLCQLEQHSCLTGEQLDTIATILRRLDETATSYAALDGQIQELATHMVEASRITAAAMALDDQVLERQGEELQRLSSEVKDAHAAIQQIRADGRRTHETIAALRDELLAFEKRVRRAAAAAPIQVRPRRAPIAGVLVPRIAAGVLAASAGAVLASYLFIGPARDVEPAATLAPTLMAGVVATTGTTSSPADPVAPVTPPPKARTSSPVRSRSVSAPRLVVTSNPSGARVTVNGIGWGSTPATIDYLPMGPKRIRVVKDGYVSEERAIVLTPSQPRGTVRLMLRPRRDTRG